MQAVEVSNRVLEVTLSADFWHQHKTVLGEIGNWVKVRDGRKTATVRLDREALEELRFNAKRHTEFWFWDDNEPEVRRAGIAQAKRVLEAIARAEKSAA